MNLNSRQKGERERGRGNFNKTAAENFLQLKGKKTRNPNRKNKLNPRLETTE